jgi:hypothetical protein
MNEEQKNYLTDRLNTFTLELSEHLAQTVAGSVKLNVNGKIDSLRDSFEAHKLEQAKYRDTSKAEYMELRLAIDNNRKEFMPVVTIFENLNWSEKVLIKLGKLLAGIVAFVVSILTIIKIYISLHK